MTTRDSRAEYERRIHQVLAHIDRHLDQPLDLEALAQVAHFSPFHFHRLFAAWLGETLGDYLRRRRVEVAASRMLAQPRLAVLPAALGVGFGSGEAFSRAFKARFGAAPTAWRAQQLAQARQTGADSKPGQVQGKPGQASGALARHDGGMQPPPAPGNAPVNTVQLADRDPVPIAYLRYTGPYGAAVGQFWQQVAYPWLAANNLVGAPRYGISHDDPSITDPAQCRYDACVEVAPGVVLSGEPQRAVLPGGRYAVLPFEGTSNQIELAWRQLLRDWLPGSGLQLDNRPCFESYPLGCKFDAQSGVFDCDLCISVTSL